MQWAALTQTAVILWTGTGIVLTIRVPTSLTVVTRPEPCKHRAAPSPLLNRILL